MDNKLTFENVIKYLRKDLKNADDWVTRREDNILYHVDAYFITKQELITLPGANKPCKVQFFMYLPRSTESGLKETEFNTVKMLIQTKEKVTKRSWKTAWFRRKGTILKQVSNVACPPELFESQDFNEIYATLRNAQVTKDFVKYLV